MSGAMPTQLETECRIKDQLSVSVHRIDFLDADQCIRVFCDTDHGPIHLRNLERLGKELNARVSIRGETIDGDPMVVLCIYPTPFYYPKVKV